MSHIHEKIDFTASAFIVNDNKVLLRYHDKYKIWTAPGGHIELDEDPIQALLREIKEETGLEIKILTPSLKQFSDGTFDLPVPAFINRHHTNPQHEHIDLIYVAKALTTEIKPSDGEMTEPENFKWLTSGDLAVPENNISLRFQQYAKQALIIAQQYE